MAVNGKYANANGLTMMLQCFEVSCTVYMYKRKWGK